MHYCIAYDLASGNTVMHKFYEVGASLITVTPIPRSFGDCSTCCTILQFELINVLGRLVNQYSTLKVTGSQICFTINYTMIAHEMSKFP